MSKNKNIPELRFPEFVNEGEWEMCKFSQLFDFGNGKDYKHLAKGDIPVYGTGGKMLLVNDFLYDGESVCIGRKGTIDNPLFLTGKFWTVDTLFYTHSFVNCLPKFIYYIFRNIKWYDYNEAGGVPSLSKTTISKIQVSIPNLPEQQKIASCLSSLDDLISVHSEKLDLLKVHKKGLMQNLFPQNRLNRDLPDSLDSTDSKTPKLRFPEFVKKSSNQENQKNQGSDNGEWVEKKLGEICDVRDGTHDSPKYIPFGFPLITSKNLTENGEIDYDNISYITQNDFDKINQRSMVDVGDILFGMIGTIGNPVIVKNIGFAIKNVALIKHIGKINQLFLLHQLKSDYILKQFEKLNAGGILKFLALGIIRNINIIVCSPAEQQKIASCLSSLDEIITAQAEKIEQLKQHKKGLMQGLFPKNV